MQIHMAFIHYEETFGRMVRHTVGDFGNKRISGMLKTKLSEPLCKDALIVIEIEGQRSQKCLK